MKNKIFALLLLVYSTTVFAQQTAVPEIYVPLDSLGPDADNLQLAISSRDYPVTPGDVYNLTFIMAGSPVSNTLLVESDYTINLDVLGEIDATDMTFPELKPIIELIIADAYPRSMPSLTIQTIGSFQIAIIGAVPQTQYIEAWGLSRLSEVTSQYLGEFSSLRNIVIRSLDGSEETYDLLKSQMLGEIDEDPYLQPGDIIIISRVNSFVDVKGAVLRPGRYQLQEDETSKDLFEFFGGLTLHADESRIRIERRYEDRPSQTMLMTSEDFIAGIELLNGDSITVNETSYNQPFVVIEGGILQEEAPELPEDELIEDDMVSQVYSSRIVYPIGLGETLYDVLIDFKDSFSSYADLENGYIVRQGIDGPLRVDMQELITSEHLQGNIVLEPNDYIAIPVRNRFVSVIGAVNLPGRFSFNPSENAFYYINLAGGFDTNRNSRKKVRITDQYGNEKRPDQPIQPGDTIDALNNNFWYNFNERFEPLTTAALFITSAISIIAILNNAE